MEEQFLGSSNQAYEGGQRSMYRTERCMDNFWLLNPHSAKRKIDLGDERESCLGTLQRSGNLQWGTRKKVFYVTKQRDSPLRLPSAEEVKEKEGFEKKSLGEGKKSDNKLGEDVNQGMSEREKQFNGDNRKRENTCINGMKLMEERREPKPKELERKCLTKRVGSSRWSAVRVERAEKSLLEVMEKMGATWDKPVLRPDLRSEARKQIGDTGLLDHLLNHLVGMIVADGKKRFVRRHNSEGKLEYWLEPADGGITNPLCACHDHYKKVAHQLKEEVNLLRSENEDLKLMILQSQVQLQLQAVDQPWKEKHDSLLIQHQKLQEQFSAISTSLLAMKEMISSMKAQKEKRMPNQGSNVQFLQERKGKEVVAESEMVSNNGFNMCNPQHAILQPNIATSGRSTPYSTSSATSAPPQLGMKDFEASQMDCDELLVAMALPTEINSEDQSFDVANLILTSVEY